MFMIRWRGREEGPYPMEELERRLAANQIGLLHQILHRNAWVTLREYREEREAELDAKLRVQQEAERIEKQRRADERERTRLQEQLHSQQIVEEKRRNDLLETLAVNHYGKPPTAPFGVPDPRTPMMALRPGRGGLIVTLALFGLFLFPPLSVVAWIMGASDLKEMDAGTMETSGRSTTGAGCRIGIFGTIIYSIVIVAIVLLEVYDR